MSTEDSTVKNNIEQQLFELEILQSMFPGDEELAIPDPLLISDLRDFIDGKHPRDLLQALDFSIHLKLDCGNSLEVLATLPPDYPSHSQPEIYIRSNTLQRDSQARINDDLKGFLSVEVLPEEPCLVDVISWVQEHGPDYFSASAVAGQASTTNKPDKHGKFSRYWIYSHHIYSKTKRKEILDLASEYCLTGFCLPGKPGIICIEGSSCNCADWWAVVRNWTWKKINLKFTEDADGSVEDRRLFPDFKEVGEVKAGGRDFHMDMGVFYKFLEQHSCQHMFRELFGFDK